jgi:hypothetical protein
LVVETTIKPPDGLDSESWVSGLDKVKESREE